MSGRGGRDPPHADPIVELGSPAHYAALGRLVAVPRAEWLERYGQGEKHEKMAWMLRSFNEK